MSMTTFLWLFRNNRIMISFKGQFLKKKPKYYLDSYDLQMKSDCY